MDIIRTLQTGAAPIPAGIVGTAHHMIQVPHRNTMLGTICHLCLSHLLHLPVHLLRGDAVVFQGEGNVLRHGQADELAVGILQHRAHNFGQTEQAQLSGVLPRHRQAAGDLPGVGIGHQAVDAVGQGGLAAAGRPGNQHLLPLADGQVDVVQGGLRLGGVLKAEMVKFDNPLVFQPDLLLKQERQANCLPLPCTSLLLGQAAGLGLGGGVGNAQQAAHNGVCRQELVDYLHDRGQNGNYNGAHYVLAELH